VTANVGRDFDPQEVAIACVVAVLAQLAFVLVFSLPSPELVEADISNDNARPIAVSITPVLKLGSTIPSKLPSQWQRKRPPPPKTEPAALPSPRAAKTLEAIPKTNVPDASMPAPVATIPPAIASTPSPETTATAAVTTPSSTPGSEQGATNGTETDPLKARAVDMYRQQVSAWFASRFNIRGKLPFEQLRVLHAIANITVTGDRKVGTFSVARASGDPIFDAEVQATLARAQSSGAELPAPPPLYPDILGESLTVRFQCNIEKYCR
jgi:hypothetical protein